MVKIKRKVKMTLPELIEWAWKNNLEGKTFYSNIDGGFVYFDIGQTLSIEHSIDKDETFNVEVEEEITGETILQEVVEFYVDGDGTQYSQRSINELKDSLSKEFWLKDGGTMTLVWKDGELVGDE